jgi:hypothetical protein
VWAAEVPLVLNRLSCTRQTFQHHPVVLWDHWIAPFRGVKSLEVIKKGRREKSTALQLLKRTVYGVGQSLCGLGADSTVLRRQVRRQDLVKRVSTHSSLID